jgi:predicted nucleic acid-binding protein
VKPAPRVTFDTSVFISYKPASFPAGFVFSAVVIQELMAAASDSSELDRWAAAQQAYKDERRLIIPTSADWLMAGKVLCWLMWRRKKGAGGKSPPLKVGASQRMALDALLAVSAERTKTAVVTINHSDFAAIQYYCPGLKVVKASDHFGR